MDTHGIRDEPIVSVHNHQWSEVRGGIIVAKQWVVACNFLGEKDHVAKVDGMASICIDCVEALSQLPRRFIYIYLYI